jgi:proteasome lid subunit RPN8/RPN11
VVITRAQVEEMVQHARTGFPNEACGLMASRDGRVTKVYCLANAEESPVTYRMDSTEQLRAMLEIDDEGWDLGAVFHSHTRTRAYPSATDVRLAFYPDTLYVIISLADPASPDVRAFRIEEGRIIEEALTIEG